MKAKKKPVTIDFYTYDEVLENKLFMGQAKFGEKKNHLIIHTLEGDHIMTRDDYLIKGVKGELYPCKIDIFEMTYDIMEEE